MWIQPEKEPFNARVKWTMKETHIPQCQEFIKVLHLRATVASETKGELLSAMGLIEIWLP